MIARREIALAWACATTMTLFVGIAFFQVTPSAATYVAGLFPLGTLFVWLGVCGELRFPKPDSLDLTFVALCTIGLVAGVTSGHPLQAPLRYSVGCFGVWVLFRSCFTTCLRRGDQIDRFLSSIGNFHLVLSIFVIYRIATAENPVLKELGGSLSTNLVAQNLYFGALGSLYILAVCGIRFLPMLTLVTCAGAMILGVTRGAWAAFAVGLLVFFSLEASARDRHERRRIVWLMVGALLVLSLAGLAVSARGFDADYISYYLNKGLSGREGIWGSAYELWRANPFLGIGFGNSWAAVSPHSTPLRYAIETGVVGLGLFLAFLFAVPIALVKARRTAEGPMDRARTHFLAAFCSGLIVLQLFDTFFLFGLGVRGFVLSIGYVLGLTYLNQLKSQVRARAGSDRHGEPAAASGFPETLAPSEG